MVKVIFLRRNILKETASRIKREGIKSNFRFDTERRWNGEEHKRNNFKLLTSRVMFEAICI